MSSVVFISIIFPKSSKLKDYSQVFPCIPHPHTSLTAFVHTLSHCFSSSLSHCLCCELHLSQPSSSKPFVSCFSFASLPHVFLLPSHSHLSPTLLFRMLLCCHLTAISLVRFSSAPSLVATFGHHYRSPLSVTTIGHHFWLPISATNFGSREWISNRKLLSVPLSQDPYEGVNRGLRVCLSCAFE